MAEIRPPRDDELAAMAAVGQRAGTLFAAVDDPRIARCADDPPFAVDDLAAYADAGRAWVAVDAGVVVGFVVVDLVDGGPHVEEVAVDPDHGGRGLGTALLEEVAMWAREAGHRAVTLTTFAAVAWNRPLYERRGYRVLERPEWTPGLVDRVAEEAVTGLDPALRVVMRREIS